MPPFCIVREMFVLVVLVLLVYAELGRVGFDDCKRNGFSDSAVSVLPSFCPTLIASSRRCPPKVLTANRALQSLGNGDVTALANKHAAPR